MIELLQYLYEQGLDCVQMFTQLAQNDFQFLMDIGTKSNDLMPRYEIAKNIFREMKKNGFTSEADFLEKNLFFTAGLWPSPETIQDRNNQFEILKTVIENFPEKEKFKAIGECGLDHHWNVNGVDGRDEADFDDKILSGESEMFEMQLDLAKKLNLPVVIHCRDAFEDTLSCLKNVGYHNGEIHCFSYGKNEAKEFLDLGWYIALGGAVTYTKKSHLEEMKALIHYIPRDRLLLETDSPYLAPVPFRGKTNTPLLITNTYQFIAEILGIDVEELGQISLKNAEELFCERTFFAHE